MAEKLHRLGSIHGNDITADLVYDDVTNDASALLYTNVTPQDAALVITKNGGGFTYTKTLPASSVAVRDNFPGPLPVTFDARGNIKGFGTTMVWPS